MLNADSTNLKKVCSEARKAVRSLCASSVPLSAVGASIPSNALLKVRSPSETSPLIFPALRCMDRPAAAAPHGPAHRANQITPSAKGAGPAAPPLPRVSIIGTAGRGESRAGLDAAMYTKMVAAADAWITATVNGGGDVHLVSGGAAWADHIAVTLFLRKRASRLTLFLPCALEQKTPGAFRYRDTGVRDFKVNPGRTANQYHDEFSKELGRDTLAELGEAARMGAALRVFDGFHARNTEVAKGDFIVALTWAPGAEPAWGGTLDTWNKARGVKHHISLTTLAPPKT